MKINFIDTTLNHLMIHGIGNKCMDEALVLSSQEVKLSEMVASKLLDNLLRKMPHEASYHYSHDIDLSYNEMFGFSQKIFNENDTFVEISKNIAKHLFNQGITKKIHSGIVYIAYLQGVLVDDKEVDALGVFKSEKTDTFLKVNYDNGIYSMSSEKGMGCIDKGCLVMNTDSENGYLVSLLNSSRNNDVKYWNEDFLGIRLRNDDYCKTSQIIELCGSFITKNEKLAKTDKAGMIDKVLSAMAVGETSLDKIADTVFEDKNVRQQFTDYHQKRENLDESTLNNNFVPDKKTVEKEVRKYRNKTKIKLDNDFEVLIKGGEKNIIKGYDEEKGMSYYKLYFKKEN